MAIFISSLAGKTGSKAIEKAVTTVGGTAYVANKVMGMFGSSVSVITASLDLAANCLSGSNSSYEGSESQNKISTVSNILGDTSGVIGITRSCALWTRLLSGHIFWKTDSKGDFLTVSDQAIDEAVGNKPASQLKKVWRSPLSIASDISLMAGRTGGALCFLDSKSLLNLGTQSTKYGVNLATMSLFMASSACSAVDLGMEIGKDLAESKQTPMDEEKRSSFRGRIYELICDIVDFVTAPLGFGVFALGGFIGSIIGSVLLLIAALLGFFREFV